MIPPLTALPRERFDHPLILRRLTQASRQLAEFKGLATSIPRQDILINTLGLQEAKDSSAIENIVTIFRTRNPSSWTVTPCWPIATTGARNPSPLIRP